MVYSTGKRYILYVSNHCVQCDNVVDYLHRKSIECLVINVDNEGDTPPEKVFISSAFQSQQAPLLMGWIL